jgi:hypothetical protein
MTNMIAGAQKSVDISALLNHTGYGGPSDAFVKAIANGLNLAFAAKHTPMVRLLIGVYPTLNGIHLPLDKTRSPTDRGFCSQVAGYGQVPGGGSVGLHAQRDRVL